ncbi:hypothetical protein [Mesorhizobium sp. M6A.T.Cr.TU.016.01.1.1]|nr:hypothetical protein [Mesorhizobium sp. M6A.T.Cr.TU.016.01.1.1]
MVISSIRRTGGRRQTIVAFRLFLDSTQDEPDGTIRNESSTMG